MLTPWKESYDQPRQHIKKQRHYFANKVPSGQSYGFFSSHVRVWELDCEEGWVPKNWFFFLNIFNFTLFYFTILYWFCHTSTWIHHRCTRTVVLEKTLDSPLDCKEIKSVHSKGDQSWVFHWKNWYWSWNSNTLATWYEELTHWRRPWCWERFMVKGYWGQQKMR